MSIGPAELILLLVIVAAVAAVVVLIRSASTGTSQRHHSALVSDATPEAFIQRAAAVVAGLPKHTLSGVGTSTLIVTRHRTAGWRVVVAILLFPVGMIALLGHDQETASIAAADDGGRTRVTLDGSFTGPLIDRIDSILS